MTIKTDGKHATLGGSGGMPPPGKFLKIGLLRLNLRAFSHQNVTLVSATLLCGIPLCLEVPERLKPSSQLVGYSTATFSTKPWPFLLQCSDLTVLKFLD